MMAIFTFRLLFNRHLFSALFVVNIEYSLYYIGYIYGFVLATILGQCRPRIFLGCLLRKLLAVFPVFW